MKGSVRIKVISIDIETYSSVNLAKSGIYRYVESDDFEILLFAYSVDGGDVSVIDIANGETIPKEIIDALEDDNVIKWAFNATFERVCLSRFLGYSVGDYLNPESWRCSLVWSAYMGLPQSLKGVGAVLKLDEQKMEEGKELIKYFCVPCSPTKTNGGRTRNLQSHDADKWNRFKEYNKRDVEVEMAIQQKLSKFPVPECVWEEYHQNERINDRGIGVDLKFVKNAIDIDSKVKSELINRLYGITKLENPNSVLQMKQWLADNGLEMESLGKKEVSDVLKSAPPHISEVLTLRSQISKSSVKKYTVMENAVNDDKRVRGMFRFYGANRTGRFASKIVQMQNLPQNHMSDLVQARALVKTYNLDALSMLYDDIPDTLSQLIRTAFVPQSDRKFIVADFSAIEARVIAWLAGEKWRIEVFKNGGDIYCASASQMFGVPVEKHGINAHLRQKGKVAELALGYGGSVGALKAMGALDMGIEENELKPLVDSWRLTNPNITRLWWNVDQVIKTAIKEKTSIQTHGLSFIYKSGFLFIELPSGRRLAYVKPKIGENIFGGESVTYEGVGATKKWERLESYGPKFVENIVQAIARDILCYAINTLSHYSIVAHVHDEIIIECNRDVSLKEVCEQMGRTPPWANGLILRADGYECNFYKKD